MTRLDDLIAHYTRRMPEIEAEIERISKLPEGKHTTHDDHDKWIKDWEESRRICRDTLAYLKTIKSREIAA